MVETWSRDPVLTPDWCSALVGVSREGLQELRTGLAGVRSQVDTDRSDVLATLAEMTRLVAHKCIIDNHMIMFLSQEDVGELTGAGVP